MGRSGGVGDNRRGLVVLCGIKEVEGEKKRRNLVTTQADLTFWSKCLPFGNGLVGEGEMLRTPEKCPVYFLPTQDSANDFFFFEGEKGQKKEKYSSEK